MWLNYKTKTKKRTIMFMKILILYIPLWAPPIIFDKSLVSSSSGQCTRERDSKFSVNWFSSYCWCIICNNILDQKMMQKSHFNLMVVVYKKIERESLYGTDHKSTILLWMLWMLRYTFLKNINLISCCCYSLSCLNEV